MKGHPDTNYGYVPDREPERVLVAGAWMPVLRGTYIIHHRPQDVREATGWVSWNQAIEGRPTQITVHDDAIMGYWWPVE